MFYIRKRVKNLWATRCIAFEEVLRISGVSGVLFLKMFKNLGVFYIRKSFKDLRGTRCIPGASGLLF